MTKACGGEEKNGHRWHARYPRLGTEPLPTDVFTSREQFELEREHVFKKVWLNVARVEQIPEAGDYFVKDIAICQTSILVVRGNDGEIRAFHNMCSHRGNKIAWDDGGSCKVFTCKFHGWAYGLEGALRHVPDEENFFDLKQEKLGLTRVACDVWNGFVFINVDPNPEESLEEFLGDLATGLQGYPFAEFSATFSRWTFEIGANWKVVKDAFQESYHVNFLHERSLPDSFTSKANPFAHFLDVQLFPRHGKGSVYGNPDACPSPVAALGIRHGSFLLRRDFEKGALPQGLNPLGRKGWTADLNVIFPGFLSVLSEGSFVTHNLWPLDVGRTLWQATQYFPKAQTVGQRFSQECGHVLVRDVATEDARTLEETQSMLASGAKTNLFLQDDEILIRHSHNVVDQMIKGQPLHITGVATAVREEGASPPYS